MLLSDSHPIFQACESGCLDKVEKLFQEGISVHSESTHNPSLIGIAAFHENKPLIELMLHYGLDITRPHNRFGGSVAEFAIDRDSVEWLNYFIHLGISIDEIDNHEYTLVNLAASGGKMECLQYLLDKGASPEKPSYHIGGTPFRNAASNNQIAAMQLLWEHGANIEILDSTKATPLISCAKGGKLEAIEWFLDHGADIHAKDEFRKTALDWAKENGHQEVAQLLQSRMNDHSSRNGDPCPID